MPKNTLFLLKNRKNRRALPPCFWRLGALPPDPQPSAAVGFAPRPPLHSGGLELHPQTPKLDLPNDKYLATLLIETVGR